MVHSNGQIFDFKYKNIYYLPKYSGLIPFNVTLEIPKDIKISYITIQPKKIDVTGKRIMMR